MSPEPVAQAVRVPEGWLLYDADCGVCARWVPCWAPTLARLGLAIAPLQAPWVAARTRAAPAALARDIRLLLADGRELVGADVYRYVLRRLWWAYPLYLLAVAPGLRRLVDRSYRAFADRRLRISAACGLRPPAVPGTYSVVPSPVSRGERRPFLTAEWRDIVVLTYEVPPEILVPLVPAGTELDLWQGRALASVVGLRFLDTRVLGVPVPLHRAFDEVNLRFYVRREVPGDAPRRGVAFVREFVPRAAVALGARLAYGEPYRVVPMRRDAPDGPGRLRYAWRWGGAWHGLAATPVGPAALPTAGSEAAFLTERHWGYTRRADGRTVEYAVEHPPWRVRAAAAPLLEADAAGLWGPPFGRALAAAPVSAVVVEGSPVAVSWPRRLPGAPSGTASRGIVARRDGPDGPSPPAAREASRPGGGT